jgi:hypothetical protein
MVIILFVIPLKELLHPIIHSFDLPHQHFEDLDVSQVLIVNNPLPVLFIIHMESMSPYYSHVVALEVLIVPALIAQDWDSHILIKVNPVLNRDFLINTYYLALSDVKQVLFKYHLVVRKLVAEVYATKYEVLLNIL